MSVSIITVTCNAASTVADCLQSVASQSHTAEHIIIDGASSDNTVETVRRIAPGARLLSEPDRGIYDAMNKGINLATGDVIGILNADDFYASRDVLTKVTQIFKNPEVMSCYGDLEYVKYAGTNGQVTTHNSELTNQDFTVSRYWKSGNYTPRSFYWGWMPPHPTFFVRKSVYERYGLFNLSLGSAADYELMLRFLLRERISTEYIPEVLVQMRTGGASNRTLAARLSANLMDRRAWEVNGLKPYPWTLLCKPLRKLNQYLVRREHKTVPQMS